MSLADGWRSLGSESCADMSASTPAFTRNHLAQVMWAFAKSLEKKNVFQLVLSDECGENFTKMRFHSIVFSFRPSND
jgi:hypothetical protein